MEKAIFENVIDQYRVDFLTKISGDYHLPLDELLAKYKILKPKIKTKVLTDPCPIKTGKGDTCKHNCVPGGQACKMHSRPVTEKPPKPPKKLKKMKIIPEHNHKPFEAPAGGHCELCDTHGDIMNPGLLDVAFLNMSLQDRLSSILSQMTATV